MARKVGQIIARGDGRWLIRVYLGRDHETERRNYHNRTIHGPMREAQAYLTKKLRERDLGRDLEGAKSAQRGSRRNLSFDGQPLVVGSSCRSRHSDILRSRSVLVIGTRPSRHQIEIASRRG